MDLTALLECVTTLSCVVTQTTSGLIIGVLLFLVAAGLTLIFGVLKVINFTHGSLYMLGAYLGLTGYRITGSFALAVVLAGLGVALFAAVFERVFMRRVYGSDVLMQLLVCYAFILILDDVVKIVWGPEFQSMGMPPAFQAPPVLFAGGVIPVFYLFLIGAAAVIALGLWFLLVRTRVGKIVRAAAHNPDMTSALGINTGMVYASVFALGGLLAGLAGALAAPIQNVSPLMGSSLIIVVFAVVVIGGMGSIMGSIVTGFGLGLIEGLTKVFYPQASNTVIFIIMAIVLLIRPAGLFGQTK